MTGKNYDTKCYALAEVFLSDEPELNTEARRDMLASIIQQAIEDYMTCELDNALAENGQRFIDAMGGSK